MRQRSLLCNTLMFIFSIVGYCSNAIIVLQGKPLYAFIAALIYVFPLFIEAVEDYSTVWVHNMVQNKISVISICIGIIYIIGIMVYLVAVTESVKLIGANYSWYSLAVSFVKSVLAIMPIVFMLSKLYDLRVALRQQYNTALAYCRDEVTV